MDHPSHNKGVEADYAKIYPDDSVQRLDVVIDAETYAAMQENMTELYGSSNNGGGPGGGGPGGGMPDEEPSFFQWKFGTMGLPGGMLDALQRQLNTDECLATRHQKNAVPTRLRRIRGRLSRNR